MVKSKKQTMTKRLTNTNYPVGDFLIRIKNLARTDKDELSVSSTKLIFALAKALEAERFLQEVKLTEGNLTMKLGKAYKKPILIDLKLVSKPGLRIYATVDQMKAKKTASSMLIVSTPKGIMSSKKAVKANMGGEVIAEIW